MKQSPACEHPSISIGELLSFALLVLGACGLGAALGMSFGFVSLGQEAVLGDGQRVVLKAAIGILTLSGLVAWFRGRPLRVVLQLAGGVATIALTVFMVAGIQSFGVMSSAEDSIAPAVMAQLPSMLAWVVIIGAVMCALAACWLAIAPDRHISDLRQSPRP